MPNNCQNILVITGSEEDLEEFTSKSEGKEFLIETYFPMPEDPGEHLKDGKPHWFDILSDGTPDWYTWRVKNWGTKWDVYESGSFLTADGTAPEVENIMEIEEGIHGHSIRVSFLSAWSPPSEAICKISNDYVNLMFTLIFCEAGNNFAGTQRFLDGKLLLQEEGSVEEYFEKYDFSNAF